MQLDPTLLPSPRLAREYADFLTALSAACQRAQIYPGGHPTLDRAVDQVMRRLEPVLAQLPAAEFAAGPNQLFWGDAATDPDHFLFRDLAARLFRRNIGRVRLARGVDRPELLTLLQTLTSEHAELARFSSPHVEVEPLDYDRLAFDDRDPDGLDADPAAGADAAWARLSGAMGGAAGRAEDPEATPDPSALALVYDAASPDPERDSRVIATLKAAAAACAERSAPGSAALRRRLVGLLGALRPATLERLFVGAADASVDYAFARDLVRLGSGPLALELLLASSRAAHRALSPALVQLLTKLASHAQSGPNRSRRLAGDELQATLLELLEGWEAGDGADGADLEYEETLDHLPTPLVPDLDPTEAYRSDPYRILTMHLDMGELGPHAARAARTLVARGRVRPLVDLLGEVRPPEPLAEELRALVATPDALAALLATRPVDIEVLERLAPEVGTAAIPLLLDALASAPERSLRRRLLGLLARFGNRVTQPSLERIPGSAWFVQRNLLRLLQMVPDPPAEAVATGFARHPDPRVRVEGLRLLLSLPAARARGIIEGLADSSLSCQRVALMAAAVDCPPAAAPFLLRRLIEGPLELGLRPAAIRALAPLVEEPAVLDLLLRLAARRLPIIGALVAPKSNDSLTALTGLARHWRWHPRTMRLLARAERHRDPAVRAAVATPTVFEQLGLVPPAA